MYTITGATNEQEGTALIPFPKNYWNLILVIGFLCVFPGCTLGPEYSRPPNAAEGLDSFSQAGFSSSSTEAEPGEWWNELGIPGISDLVKKALAANTDLRAAAHRITEARALLDAAHGDRFPELGYNISAGNSKISFVLPSTGRTGIESTTFTQEASASYLLDFFGRVKRSSQAANADYMATSADKIALSHSIIAAVISSRVWIDALLRQLAIADEDIENRGISLEMVETRYFNGLAEPLDVHMARENLAASRAARLEIVQAVTEGSHALDILCGEPPGYVDFSGDDLLPDLPAPVPAPVGLPAHLLDRRPDIASMELRLTAATARVGIAVADLFPSLTLTANGGIQSDDLMELTSTSGLVYSIISRMTAPIFSGGKLRATVRAADAHREALVADYSGAVLNALREVENALASEKTNRMRLAHLEERLFEAQAAERLANTRYRQGVQSLLTLLETERRRFKAEIELVAVRTELWNVRIDLFLALGGDWENG